MADTVRTVSALKTLLADNTSGAISPQDLRDMLVSLVPGWGSYYISTPAATTIVTPGTFVKAAGTTTAINLSDRFDMPANNRLRYLGTPDVHVRAAASLSLTCAADSQDLAVAVRKNGNPLTGAEISLKIVTGASEVALALEVDCNLSTNDYLELWVTNETAANAVTLTHLYFVGHSMAT